MFWGDHWIGVEPYMPGFQEMGIDIHIGAAEDGVALRRVSDRPGPQEGTAPLSVFLPRRVPARAATRERIAWQLGQDPPRAAAQARRPHRLWRLSEPRAQVPRLRRARRRLCDEFRTFQANAGGGESLEGARSRSPC